MYKGCAVPAHKIEECIMDMQPDCRVDLIRMIEQIKRGVRFFVIPLHDRSYFHWHMLILDMEKRKIFTRNSMWGPRSKPAAARVVSSKTINFTSLNLLTL